MSQQAPAAQTGPGGAAAGRSGAHGGGLRPAVTLAALGVVFGDIGTSPIYTIQTLFNPDDPHPVPLTEDNVVGLCSLIVWSVTLVVTLLYVGVVLRADNRGEGGILSLVTLVGGKDRHGVRPSARTVALLAGAGVAGASLFLADGMITPAISVLSAVEGLQVADPDLSAVVLPAAIVIIVLLFAAQRFGTARVGRLFGPVMLVWFAVIGVAGLVAIVRAPGILRAVSPTYAVGFFLAEPGIAFFALAAVVLAITGAEALYADLGHFGRAPISRAWLFLVYPACVLSYLGQGALLTTDLSPDGPRRAPFFLLVPDWALIPLVILATAATVIASQAVITGAFSVVQQAIRLGYLPRLRIVHTSAETIGQVYIPFVNWGLLIAVLALVLIFRSSAALAFAFGMAVICTVTITTTLVVFLAMRQWSWPRPAVVAGAAVILFVELLFLSANFTKLISGAWLPLVVALALFTVMTTWQRGRHLVTARRQEQEGSLQGFVQEVRDAPTRPLRVPGTAVYLNRGTDTVPLALRATLEHTHVLLERVVIVSIDTAPVPYVPAEEIAHVDDLTHRDDGISRVLLRFGYQQRTDVPAALARIPEEAFERPLELADASWFLSTIDLVVGHGPGLPRWRRALFVATSHLTTDAAEAFDLPRDQTVIIGSRIEV